MAPTARPATESPRIRAELARKRLKSLPANQIVYVDRLGPRILTVPPNPTASLDRQTLRDLNRGHLTGCLGQGARFLSKWMMQSPEITLHTNGHYTVQKKKNGPNTRGTSAFTVKTLDIWTGKPGEPHDDRSIEDLIFYSIGPDLLPSYYSWKDDRLERRESSLELESQEEAALAKQEYVASPRPISELLDDYEAKEEAKMDEDASNDPENMLRFKPHILPSDPAWEGVEEYFKWILQFEREESQEAPQIYKVLQDEFLESQLLLAIPATNSGYRAKIQDENTERYHEALRTTFRGKPNNLATKLTMLCFGLPIEPLTATNVKFAGGLEDVRAEDDETAENQNGGQMIERIMWSERPLEFLDYYNQRSYGYPMIRTPKRKYEEFDNETIEQVLAQAQQHAKNPRLIWDRCGFPEMDELEQGLHLRGGAGNPAELLPEQYILYTEMGCFLMDVDNSFGAFSRLTERLFELGNRGEWACQIDLIPVIYTTNAGAVADKTREYRSWQWIRRTKHDFQPQTYNSWVTSIVEAKDRLFRVRYNPNYPKKLNSADIWEPEDSPAVVNLHVEDVGTAYWYLPSNPHGVNMLQDTFRNAIECLIPQHKMHRVRWLIPGREDQPISTGQLLLIAEAPSMELWNATQKALGSRSRVDIYLTVLEENSTRSDQLAVKILMPGFNQVGSYNRLPEDQLGNRNPDIFPAIRNFVRQKTLTDQTRVRIWAGVELYEDPSNLSTNLADARSMVLPAEEDVGTEEDIWQSEFLALTFDAVVVKPDFDNYRIICVTNQLELDIAYENCPSEELGTSQGLLTLANFRRCVRRLSGNFNLKKEYISIEQPQSDNTFLIGPAMTERQWRTQVFDWLYSPTILYRQHQNWSCQYAREIIEGPLGPTYNGVPPQLPPEPSEAASRRTPPLFEDPPPGVTVPKKGNKLIVKLPNTGPGHMPAIEKPAMPPAMPHTEPPTVPPTVILIESPKGPEIGPEKETGSGPGPAVSPPTGPSGTGLGTTPARTDPLSREVTVISSEGYREYRNEQAVQDFRRIESYSENESIYESIFGDEEFPEIPMFGPALEGYIPGAGPNFPVVYTSVSTPTENVHRDRELEDLRRIVLERLDYCNICQRSLPAGDHNLDQRERHFQKHRDLEAEDRRNIVGTSDTPTQVSNQDVFYCEYCGRTPAEFEKDNEGKKHGPSCAQRAIFHDVPKYCQYCRLNFWDNDMTKETFRNHVQTCANDRRVSLQGQVNLYQKLLSRAVGNLQPNGDSTCHFDGCQQIFNSATTNLARANHFFEHLDRNDNEARNFNDAPNSDESKRCPFENCNMDLSHTTEDEMISHLREHVGWDDDDICQIPDCSMQLEGLTSEQVVTHLQEHIVDENESPVRCPVGGCHHIFANWTQQQVLTHINIHFGRNLRRCPFRGCALELVNFTAKEHMEHILRHIFVTHCPFQHCRLQLDGLTEQERRTHLNVHLGPKRGPTIHRCPFEGCLTTMRAWPNQKRFEHMSIHIAQNGQLPPWASPKCPFENCMTDFTNKSRAQISQHLQSHNKPAPENSCPFCTYNWDGADEEEFRNHFYFTHHPTNPPNFMCLFCNNWVTNDKRTILRHYQGHTNDNICAWDGCHYQYAEGVTADDRRRHLLTHTRLACQWPDCDHIAPLRSTPEATAEERRDHLLWHVRQSCPWRNCDYRFSENATQRDIEKHFLHQHVRGCHWPKCNHKFGEQDGDAARREHYGTHVGSSLVTTQSGATHGQSARVLQCQWPDCEHKFVENATAGDIAAHSRTHLPVRCPFPGCGREWQEGAPPNDIRAHILSHAPSTCPIPDCGYIFPQSATDAQKVAHIQAHGSSGCQWPGCANSWVENPSDEDIIAHILEHAHTHDVPPGPRGPEIEGLSIQDQNPPAEDVPAEDQNNIPPHRKALHPGMDFYCPACFYKVSGGNVSACKRHRGKPCRVIGHDNWLIGTDEDRQRWKDDAANARNTRKADPSKATPKKAAPKSLDPTYKPPDNEEPDDDDNGGEEAAEKAGPGKGGRKRKRTIGSGDGTRDEAGSSSKKQKKDAGLSI